jgi:hypothetical protein
MKPLCVGVYEKRVHGKVLRGNILALLRIFRIFHLEI